VALKPVNFLTEHFCVKLSFSTRPLPILEMKWYLSDSDAEGKTVQADFFSPV